MMTFKDYLLESYDYSSIQVKLPNDISKKIIEFGNSIPDNELSEDGRDSRPHITVKYGINSGSIDVMKDVELPSKITAMLGKTSLFENDNDVLKIDIVSDDIVKLNTQIEKKLKTTSTFDGYTPHATIAYLKSGKGKKYANDDRFEGIKIVFDAIEFSSKDDDEYVNIKL